MSFTRADVVLVRPSRPANVAAACRAMKNMGLRRLWLVHPPMGLDQPEARSLAYGAWDVLDGAFAAASLKDAVAGAVFVAGTSGRVQQDTLTPRQLAALAGARAGEGRLALVFGPEASGLTDAELGLCHAIVRIPTHAAHSSLNLAQAVLVLGYELLLAADAGPIPEEQARASAAELEGALDALRDGLLGIGYLNPENPELVLTELRRLCARAGPTQREVTLLRGVARQIGWAATRLKTPEAP